MTVPTLYTIGYEKALQQNVLAALTEGGVATLIDVRDRPISRRPGFSKRQLAAAIEDAGMRYVHLKALGTPPEGRLANRRREWERFWGIVEEKLARPESELDLRQAAEIARAAPSCRCATRPIGEYAIAAGSPRSWLSALGLRCATSREQRYSGAAAGERITGA
jgi:uncharacterized protein (DUF488 family)